jgi:hypothetical protein
MVVIKKPIAATEGLFSRDQRGKLVLKFETGRASFALASPWIANIDAVIEMPTGCAYDTVSIVVNDTDRDLLQKRTHHSFVEKPLDKRALPHEVDHAGKKTTGQIDATGGAVEHGEICRKRSEPTTEQGERLTRNVIVISQCSARNGGRFGKGRIAVAYGT